MSTQKCLLKNDSTQKCLLKNVYSKMSTQKCLLKNVYSKMCTQKSLYSPPWLLFSDFKWIIWYLIILGQPTINSSKVNRHILIQYISSYHILKSNHKYRSISTLYGNIFKHKLSWIVMPRYPIKTDQIQIRYLNFHIKPIRYQIPIQILSDMTIQWDVGLISSSSSVTWGRLRFWSCCNCCCHSICSNICWGTATS